MSLLPVEEALKRVVAGLKPTEAERVPIGEAYGRVLAADVAARITQPPFDSSSMDGYAARSADLRAHPKELRVIGEAGAGHAFDGHVGEGEAARIFTGAPLPKGADTVVIQEHTERTGDVVTVLEGGAKGDFIRPSGLDFSEKQTLLETGRRLSSRDVALAASMNHGDLMVRRRPVVAILSTGDELVPPGETPRADQIISSNGFGLAAIVEQAGSQAELLGIAKDTLESLAAHVDRASGADILVTIGGASVGDHDLVQQALEDHGMTLDFWKIAMRPGKPLMFGEMAGQRVLGVPGNAVSALLCARIFLVPMIHRMLGLAEAEAAPHKALLAAALEANGPRQHYMRATGTQGKDGALMVTPVTDQDSSLLSPLAHADCLIVRPPHAPAAESGTAVDVLPLDF